MERTEINLMLRLFSDIPCCGVNEKQKAKMMGDLIKVLAKQEPITVRPYIKQGSVQIICPHCDTIMSNLEALRYEYCPHCGQMLNIEEDCDAKL